MLFSQRQGLDSIKKTIQIDFVDKELRNSLWNYLSLVYLQLHKIKPHKSNLCKKVLNWKRRGFYPKFMDKLFQKAS